LGSDVMDIEREHVTTPTRVTCSLSIYYQRLAAT
jgi:hypothetical protein